MCGRHSPRDTCKLIHTSDQPGKMVLELSPGGMAEVSLPGPPRHSCNNPGVPSSLARVRLRMEMWLNTK